MRLCRDVPVTCANPYPGSPWQVPYRIEVAPSTNLTPLSPQAGVVGWTAYQGGAAHTGYVPGSVNPAALGRRWVRTMGPNGQVLNAAVVDGGRVFVTVSNMSSTSAPRALIALSEEDGQELWSDSHDWTEVQGFSPPTVAQGRVFVGALTLTGNWTWTLRSYDPVSGQALAQSTMRGSGLSMPMGPTGYGDSVYAPATTGTTRHLAVDATQTWASAVGNVTGFITPAVDGGAVYVYTDDRLVVLDPASGGTRSTIVDTGYVSNTAFMSSAPVLGGGGRVYATSYGSVADGSYGGRLLAFDTTLGSVAWTVAERFQSNAVLVGSTLYVVNDRRLQARDADTGTLLWQWTPAGPAVQPTGPNTPLLVVGQHAFVGLNGKTFAVDLQTHQSTWSYPFQGSLAASAQGVLYIVVNAGLNPRLHAINLL